jgi:glutaconate CoA-transferase subunit A
MSLVRGLIRHGVKDLHLITVPTGGFAAELLIGAGCVASVETSGISLGEVGGAPRFGEAIKSGLVKITDSTCPAVYSALQAGEKGIPFIPIRGVLGADIAAQRSDWKEIENPYGKEGDQDPILLLPAIRPDVALIHARRADRNGNVWIGRERELATMAHAALKTLVTVEEVVEDDLLAEEITAAGTIAAFYISGIAQAQFGAKPGGMNGCYLRDEEHIAAYAKLARSEEGFRQYLDANVFDSPDRQVA